MEARKDLYFVVRGETDTDWFPPASFFGLNQFTETPERIYTVEVDVKLLTWKVSVNCFERDCEEVLNIIRNRANTGCIYFSQPFSSWQSDNREFNLSFFRRVSTEFESAKLLIRNPEDKVCREDLSLLKQELGLKLTVHSCGNTPKTFKSVFLAPRKQQSVAINPVPAPPVEKLPEEVKSVNIPAQEESKAEQFADFAQPFPSFLQVSPPLPPAQEESKAAQLADSAQFPRPLHTSPPPPSELRSEEQKSLFVSLLVSNAKNDLPHPRDSSVFPAEDDIRCVMCLLLSRDMLSADCCGAAVCRNCAPQLPGRCPACQKRSQFAGSAQSLRRPLRVSPPPPPAHSELRSEEQKSLFVSLPVSSAKNDPPRPHDSSVFFAEEDVRCIVCLSLFHDMLSAECCGVVVCRVCAPRLSNQCPVCRKYSHFVQNKALSRILSGLPEKCVCGEEVASKNLENHKKKCPNRMFTCPSCNFTLDRNGLKQHLKDIHRVEILLRLDRNPELLSSE